MLTVRQPVPPASNGQSRLSGNPHSKLPPFSPTRRGGRVDGRAACHYLLRCSAQRQYAIRHISKGTGTHVTTTVSVTIVVSVSTTTTVRTRAVAVTVTIPGAPRS